MIFIFFSRFESLSTTGSTSQLMRQPPMTNSPRSSPHLGYRGVHRSFLNSNSNYNNNNNQQQQQRRYYNNNNNEPPSTPVRTTTVRHTANLLASLDKSILQIRDWLTLLEGMIKKDRVDLSNRSHIYHMLERQKVS